MNPAEIATTVGTVVGGMLSGGGLVAIINAFAKRRTIKVDAADKLSEGALRWVDEFQAEAREARAEAQAARVEAHAARQEAAEARTQMREVRSEAQQLAGELRRLRKAILDPNASIERLRLMVDPQGNGGATAGAG